MTFFHLKKTAGNPIKVFFDKKPKTYTISSIKNKTTEKWFLGLRITPKGPFEGKIVVFDKINSI